MSEALDPVNNLIKRIGDKLEPLGLQVEETYTVTIDDEQETLSFRVTVLPGAVITASDGDENAFNEMFKQIIEGL